MNQIRSIKETFREDSGFAYLLTSIVITGLSFGLYKGMLDNYLAEVVNMGELDRGVTEFFRELPGIALVLILAVFYLFRAETLFKAGMGIMALGMAMLALLPSEKGFVILSIFVFSLGEHIQFGMKNPLTLQYARPGKGGAAQGIQNACNQMGTLMGYLVIVGVFSLAPQGNWYRPFFTLAAALVLLSLLCAMKLKGNSSTDPHKRRFYFRRKYCKYYMLEMFYGARKQVFLTFGPYVLILFYGADAAMVSLFLPPVPCAASSRLLWWAASLTGWATSL